MSFLLRRYDIANLFLVVGGFLMFFFHMFALAWPGYNPWDPFWLWYEGPVPHGIFLGAQIVGSIGGVFAIVLAYIWNKEHNHIFASIITFFMVFDIFSGVIHANISFYGLGFGIPLLFSGLLVLLGGAAKYNRYSKILALGAPLFESNSQELSEGIVEALKNYGRVDLNRYIILIQESLQYLSPGKETLPNLKIDEKKEEIKEEEVEEEEVTIEEKKEEQVEEVETEPQEEKKDEEDDKFAEIENTVLETIKQIEGEDGALWDLITEKCEKAGLEKDSIEEALTSLMDKGLIYEPILGTIKTT